MYKILVLLFAICLSGCSSKKGTTRSPDEYLELNKTNYSKHQACIQQKKEILEKAITIAEDAELNDELYFFVRDEKKAIYFLENFDLSKFTLVENQLEFEAIINACVLERSPKHITCDSLMPAYDFFRGLIYGMNQYNWSQTTILKAREITLKYLKYVGESESSLMDILLGNDLLMRLSLHGYVNKDLYKKTIALKAEGEKSYKELRKQIRKLEKKKLTCDGAITYYSSEREKVKDISKKLQIIVPAP